MIIPNYSGVILTSGGRLFYQKWKYDTKKAKGEYVSKDVTSLSHRFMLQYCHVMEDVILKDIFLLISHNLDIFDCILGNWCKEYTERALNVQDSVQNLTELKYTELKSLEVYQEIISDDNETEGFSRLQFHGIGVDENPDENLPYWSLMCSDIESLVFLPLKVNKNIQCYKNVELSPFFTLKNVSFTLLAILDAIFYEISYCGGPEESLQVRNKILEDVNESITE